MLIGDVRDAQTHLANTQVAIKSKPHSNNQGRRYRTTPRDAATRFVFYIYDKKEKSLLVASIRKID